MIQNIGNATRAATYGRIGVRRASISRPGSGSKYVPLSHCSCSIPLMYLFIHLLSKIIFISLKVSYVPVPVLWVHLPSNYHSMILKG